ncbi:hypothetical protein [Hymenobacter sp. B1770]
MDVFNGGVLLTGGASAISMPLAVCCEVANIDDRAERVSAIFPGLSRNGE